MTGSLTIKLGSSGGGGSTAWGAITGTLSNQTDLQAAIDLKASLSGATFTGTVVAPALRTSNAIFPTRTLELNTGAGVQWSDVNGSGFSVVIRPDAPSANRTLNFNPDGNFVSTADVGTVTDTMLAGSIAPSKITGTAAILGANTFTALQQFTGTTHAGLRLNNLTTAERDAIASPQAGMAIWNTTAARLQLHNGSAWTAGMVRLDGDTMTGALTIPVGSAAATSLNFGTAGTGLYSAGANTIGFATDGVVRATLGLAGGVGNLSLTTPSGNPTITSPANIISLGSSGCNASLCNGLWVVSSATGNLTSSNRAYLLSLGGDVALQGDAADVLAQRRGTNAQSFRLYGTYTDASNYVRLALTTTSTTMSIVCQTAGTGADDIDLTLTPAGTGNVRFGTHSAVGAETITGFITIKDSGGTSRKLAVIS